MGHIKIIENTSEIGAGTRGAGLGVGALQVVAHNQQSGYFGRYERLIVPSQNDILNEPTQFNYGKRIDGLVRVYQDTAEIVSSVLTKGDFPIVLAGDHASAGGTIAGIKKAHPTKRLGVIWIDAHADLHTPYTTPSGNLHGMPLATALNTDNLACQINQPKEETKVFWEKLKATGGIQPKVLPTDLIFIGVRDTEGPEDELIAREGIKNFTVSELRTKGLKEVVEETAHLLEACDIVYISFDVDSMDCIMVSKGTGTPVENGLSPEEANDLMCAFANWKKTVCVEIVEINPCLDNKTNLMAETAYSILENFTPIIEKRI